MLNDRLKSYKLDCKANILGVYVEVLTSRYARFTRGICRSGISQRTVSTSYIRYSIEKCDSVHFFGSWLAHNFLIRSIETTFADIDWIYIMVRARGDPFLIAFEFPHSESAQPLPPSFFLSLFVLFASLSFSSVCSVY